MTNFYKIIDEGYITAIGTNGNNSVMRITESEYFEILAAILKRPTAQDGFGYKLNAENLEWEPVELPDLVDEEAGPEDYESALAEMGVDFSD